LARHWILAEQVLSGEKKAEADVEIGSVQDLLEKGYSGRIIRYWLLSNHYRKPLHFSFEGLDQAGAAIRRIDECLSLLQGVEKGRPYPDLDQLLYDLKTGFSDAMDDDLNVPSAMAAIFQIVRKVNRLVVDQDVDLDAAKEITSAFRRVDAVLNIFDFEAKPTDAQVEGLILEREEARQKKDWARADRIRDQLLAMGVAVRDRKTS
jgi:cysteinyl-tRNA synthetase